MSLDELHLTLMPAFQFVTDSELLNRITLAGGRPVNPMIVGNGFRPHITGADDETKLPTLNRITATRQNDDGQFENIASIEINKG